MPRINQSTPVLTTVDIHNIVILDRSGSMKGEKYHATVEWIVVNGTKYIKE